MMSGRIIAVMMDVIRVEVSEDSAPIEVLHQNVFMENIHLGAFVALTNTPDGVQMEEGVHPYTTNYDVYEDQLEEDMYWYYKFHKCKETFVSKFNPDIDLPF